MSKKTWIIFVAMCVLALGSLIYLSQNNRIDVSNVDQNALQTATADNGQIADHTYGQPASKVTLIEYGDYQCPGCSSVAPVIKDVVEKYKGQITYVFRNMPLSQLHPNARAAAAAAEAAGLQGKFWEMHDLLYTQQRDWKDLSGTERGDRFANYAQQMGLDVAKFKSDIDDPRISQKLNYDVALARKSNVEATPSFFVNGQAVTQVIKNGAIVPAGTKDAAAVWSDRTALGKLVIEPALTAAGIALPVDTTTQQ